MIEDRLLIWKCKQGSRSAFRRIYEKYESDLRNLAANLLDDKAVAEDIVHDAFISLLQTMGKFELKSSLASYLKTCVANKSRDYMRKKRPQAALVNEAEQVMSNDDGPIHLVMQSEQSRQLDSAISRLPYEQREAVMLYMHGRMKFRMIAKIQKVSVKTAHRRYRAGLDRLRSMLNSELQE